MLINHKFLQISSAECHILKRSEYLNNNQNKLFQFKMFKLKKILEVYSERKY